MIIESFRRTPQYQRLRELVPAPGDQLTITGLAGSSPVVLAAALAEEGFGRSIALIAPDAATAEEVEVDLDILLAGRARSFPQRESVHPELDDPHVEISAKRVDAIQALLSGRAKILVTSGRALSERFMAPANWSGLKIELAGCGHIVRDQLIETLEKSGYQKVPMVEAVGEYSVRGGIVDVFTGTHLDPIRLELWGDRIESIRTFDVLDQRSLTHLDGVQILPVRFPDPEPDNTTGDSANSGTSSLLEILAGSTLIIQIDPQGEDTARRRGWDELARRTETPEKYQHAPESVGLLLRRFGVVRAGDSASADIDFDTRPPANVDRKIERLLAAVDEAAREGGKILILCDNDGQLQRLEEILEDAADATTLDKIILGLGPLAGGFVLPSAEPPLWLFTDHEIFRRARRPRTPPRQASGRASQSLSALAPEDYVVHLDHGIGRFLGLERVKIAGEELETLVIEYAGGAILRVPHYRADLIERWLGEADETGTRQEPTLHRLGGKSWQRLKKRTQNSIRAMAAELLELYAARRVAQAHAFSSDTRWQREMESAFIYEETPDQERVVEQVKRDMEQPRPMDRLVCGDVGYGKTEIAIRAAFKAAQDGKQVAVLAPTTVLVEQHLQTFRARLAEYPVTIEALSRFRTAKEQERVIERLRTGALDIVIGTHRLLSPDVQFKDLGLVVIDEEQRFGVAQKERLKELKRSVDVITMTATPIPRTLHLSISGLRDLSLIRTPPRNRRPIITHMMTWNDQMIEDAIRLEADRGGQVFFVHNRVESIEEVAARVRRLVVELRVEVAHGQLPERKLERVMTDFVRGDIGVLVSTAIIENGLDVPNANTIIIHRADYFGLAQLHQLRGRVGRSHQRAYCYLVIPSNLPVETERRLQMLEQHTDLGAGYRIALKDLELRGAGNLLGPEQSGFAHAVGFDMYLRLLEDTVAAMKSGASEPASRLKVPEVSLSGATYLPDAFIPDQAQKLDVYRRLSKVGDIDELEQLLAELKDRYGRLPHEAQQLIATSKIRILGRRLGVERVLATADTARVNFRRGTVPRLTALRDALSDRDVAVEVRRLQPLSLLLRVPRAENLTPTLIDALRLLVEDQPELVKTG